MSPKHVQGFSSLTSIDHIAIGSVTRYMDKPQLDEVSVASDRAEPRHEVAHISGA